ncbi:MAG: hypothetical protein R3F04_05590 [Lysobacteraceae bacterium]
MIELRFPTTLSSILRHVGLVLAVGWSSPSSAVARHWETYVGDATDLDSGEWRYRERHLVQFDPDLSQRLIIYECADGTAFARKWIDYRRSTLAPDFVLQDAARGTVEGAVLTASAASSFRFEPDNVERVHSLSPDEIQVVDAGFDVWIEQSWMELLEGGEQRVPLLIPSRGESYRFSVQAKTSAVLDHVEHTVVEARLASWIGFWLPKIEVTYRLHDRWLRRFEGPTNLRDGDNQLLTVRIEFPQLPQPAGASDWAHAFAAPLQSCQASSQTARR